VGPADCILFACLHLMSKHMKSQDKNIGSSGWKRTRAAERPVEGAQPAPEPKKLLDVVRDAIRVRHYSIRTERSYLAWIKRFILFHKKRHPKEMGEREIEAFLTPYGEFSRMSIKCAISAGWGQNGGTFSSDLDRLTDEFRMLGRKGTGLSTWFLSHARTAMLTIRLLPNGCRDE